MLGAGQFVEVLGEGRVAGAPGVEGHVMILQLLERDLPTGERMLR